MAQVIRWRDLTIGLLAAASVMAAALGVLIFGRVGTLHGATFTLHVTTDAARGVIKGTEVWLDGQKVGLVRAVDFQSSAVSPRDRLVLELDVLESARSHIRKDTQVAIRAGATLIGDQVVYLTSGTARMREVADGDTVHSTAEQSDFEEASAEATLAAKELPAIMSNVKLLTAQLKSVDGTLGALGADAGSARIQGVRARASAVLARLSGSTGTFGRAMNDRELLMGRARHAMAQTDSIRALLASNEHSLGRFRRDSTIKGEITNLRAELSELQRLASSPNGTVGRLRADSAIVRNIHRDMAALDSLLADMKKHPLRYNPF